MTVIKLLKKALHPIMGPKLRLSILELNILTGSSLSLTERETEENTFCKQGIVFRLHVSVFAVK